MDREIKITQVKSVIGSVPKHRRTMRALGLTKMHQTVVHQDTPQIRGMIRQVIHLVKVEE
ncbi:MAG: 50S ribosomal protein L30 [Pseudomonadota bacterium]